MTDSQTRQCSKWQRENTHQSPLSLWHHHVTAEGEHLQIRHASQRLHGCLILKQPSAVGESTRARSTRVCKSFHMGNKPWSLQGRFPALSKGFQACFITYKPHQGRWC